MISIFLKCACLFQAHRDDAARAAQAHHRADQGARPGPRRQPARRHTPGEHK